MSNPTSNFNWQMPTATDLVTDLPADFEVFGQAVDTSLADLKGGTTGQFLKKNTNADMDFVWGAGSTSPLTTKGDLYTYSTADARLGVGANGTVLQADSTQGTGIKWTQAGRYLLASGSLSGSTLDLTSITGNYEHLEVVFKNYFGSVDQAINGTINNDSGANQYGSAGSSIGNITYNAANYQPCFTYDSTNTNNFVLWRYYDYTGDSHKLMQGFFNSSDQNLTNRYVGTYYTTIYKSTAAISRLTYTTSAGTWAGGTYELWGVK